MVRQRWGCWAVVWAWVWGLGLTLSPALASVLPVGVNLIPNVALQGVPGQAPREMFHGVSYDPSVARRGSPLEREGELRVDYAYSRDQAGKGVMHPGEPGLEGGQLHAELVDPPLQSGGGSAGVDGGAGVCPGGA